MNEVTNFESNLPSHNEMEMLIKYCELISKAPAYAAMGGMPGIFALVMTARELGIGPMTALNGGMYLIPPAIDKEGRPKGSPNIMMAAKTMSMMILKSGHKIEPIEVSSEKVSLKGTRSDTGVSFSVTMTMKDAQTAQLSHDMYGKPKLWSPWFKNPEDMLWKTCVAKLGRRMFTDVIGNAYEPAEFESKQEKQGCENASSPASEKKPKKLTGKKIVNAIGNIDQSETLQLECAITETKDQFIKRIVASECADENDCTLLDFMANNAKRRSMTKDEMTEYCMKNEENFLTSYRNHKSKIASNACIQQHQSAENE